MAIIPHLFFLLHVLLPLYLIFWGICQHNDMPLKSEPGLISSSNYHLPLPWRLRASLLSAKPFISSHPQPYQAHLEQWAAAMLIQCVGMLFFSQSGDLLPLSSQNHWHNSQCKPPMYIWKSPSLWLLTISFHIQLENIFSPVPLRFLPFASLSPQLSLFFPMVTFYCLLLSSCYLGIPPCTKS